MATPGSPDSIRAIVCTCTPRRAAAVAWPSPAAVRACRAAAPMSLMAWRASPPMSAEMRLPWAMPALSLLAKQLLAGEIGKRLAGQPVAHPFVHGHGADGPVELDGRFVPVQHAPLEASAATGHRDARQLLQHGLAGTRMAVGGRHVEVLQVKPLPALPGGVVEEVDGESTRHAAGIADQRADLGLFPEQRP